MVLRAERLSRAWRALSRLDTRVEKAVWFWARLQEERRRRGFKQRTKAQFEGLRKLSALKPFQPPGKIFFS